MIGKKSRTVALVALHCLLAVYSLSGVLSKLAAGFSFDDFRFYLCYCGIIALLGLYAIGWQQIIKRLPLTTAYANKAVTVVWGIIWGIALFSEQINVYKVVGAFVVLAGVALYALADSEAEEQERISS